MDFLAVNGTGLGMLASQYDALARRLNSLPTPPVGGPAGHATTLAVTEVNTSIGSTGTTFVARMQWAAAKLGAADTAYADRDASTASDLHTAGQALDV